ncbi:hypothetical protein FWH13_00265 [Candidatus Saccharibacteria bacterium]|nr:hypothetical protein [Candidatus Saccharibacteria bacterium]
MVAPVSAGPIGDPTIVAGVRRLNSTGAFQKDIVAQPGEVVEAMFIVYNTTTLAGIRLDVRANMNVSGQLTVVGNSARVFSRQFPDGQFINSQDITQQFSLGRFGIYNPSDGSGSATVRFNIKVPAVDQLKCGRNAYHWNAQVTGYDNDTRNIITNTNRYDVSIIVDGLPCDTPPPTPPPLPPTGPVAVATGIAGAVALATAGGYFVISRKK